MFDKKERIFGQWVSFDVLCYAERCVECVFMVARCGREREKRERERMAVKGMVGMDRDRGGQSRCVGSLIDSPDTTMDENSDPHGHGYGIVWYRSKYPALR